MINPNGCVEFPLTVFGGLNSELRETDLPPGLSPSCSDVAFLPGEVFTRPSFKRYSTLGTTAQIVYTASFLKPDGTVVQLVFDANGGIFANGVKVGTTQAANRFKTCAAFGKTFIATSDGVHGADVPLQYTKEGWLDRVSQDGPGGGVSLANYPIPQASLVAGSAGAGITITSATPIDPQQVQVGDDSPDPDSGYRPPRFETYYTALEVVTTSAHGLSVGQLVVIAGNTEYNFASAVVDSVVNSTTFLLDFFGQSSFTGTGGTVTPQAPLLARSGNTVTAQTASANNLRVGYRVNVSGIAPMAVGGGIASIVIDNANYPGVATITTEQPHGLTSGVNVQLSGVNPVDVGGGITNWAVVSGVQTCTTASPHGLQPGASIFERTGGTTLDPSAVVSVPSATTFTFNTPAANTSGTSGDVQLVFPLSTTPENNVFTVAETPTPTTFQIPFSYVDGTWTSGALSFAWNGSFYVSAVQSATQFQYQQTGPDAVLASGSGIVTPQSQIAPGQRQCVCIFQTRTGFLTAPSPTVTYTAAGQQYLLVTNIPIGPANVVARILAFTGANGADFFYLPAAPSLNGQVIGTSTVINDNTTTSAIFDFSDDALFASIAIDQPGNDLFRQVVLGPCLGFHAYAGRLFAWGERNKVQAFWNMGFEGGVQASAANVPLGWTVTGSGTLTAGDYGLAWTPNAAATISQNAYQDRFGQAILQPNTSYLFRAWTAHDVTATLSSASTGFTATATVTASGASGQAAFSQPTPAVLPSDLTLTLSSSGAYAMDELEIIYANDPYVKTVRASYVGNPEAFDSVTGILGPASDPNPVQGMEERRDVLMLLTSGPHGSLYETEDTASREPNNWSVRHVAAECGLMSVWGTAKFEDWFCWASDTGLRIYDGGTVDKMSQEVQTLWDAINPVARQLTVLANDPYTRRLYVSAATGTATVHNALYVLDYRELNTAAALTNAGSLRISMQGKMITTDLTRKWAAWVATMNYCGLITQPSGAAVMAFCGGNGVSLSGSAHSTVYTLAEGVIDGNDDDYGPFWSTSTYHTYFFVTPEEAQQKDLGTHRLLHNSVTLNVSGVGSVFVTPHLNATGNTGKVTRAVAVSSTRDREFGLRDQAERISYQISCQPAGTQPAPSGSPAGFSVSLLTLAVKTNPYSPVAGWNK